MSDRTEPAVITVRTDFLYSEPRPGERTDVAPHCFSYRSYVTDHGDFQDRNPDDNGVDSTVRRMIAAFGDDSDLEIIVRRKDVAAWHAQRRQNDNEVHPSYYSGPSVHPGPREECRICPPLTGPDVRS
ncbi:hypothetical protein [Mycobacterium hubeiense]|uniref:hypothetical protein n=1 Tax=Mycobacterium hubeiense TaxID=1867256 RepID=UPI000C7F464B|nr:hypothetical protein [Mycobacterium sp. QGD 101]